MSGAKNFLVVFLAGLSGLMVACKDDSPSSSNPCVPECSAGFFCLAGTCVQECNPTCSPGLLCNENRECVPDPADAGSDADATDVEIPDAQPVDVGTDTDGSAAPDVVEDTETDGSSVWPFDYPAPECEGSSECAEDGAVCVGGACVAPIAADDYVFDGAYGLVTSFEAPTDECCFDLDGDGFVDNELATLLSALSATGSNDPIAQADEMLQQGELALIVEAREDLETSTLGLGLLIGASDLDSDGTSDFTLAEREGGDAVLQIQRSSLGVAGPAIGFPRASIAAEGNVLTTVADFDVSLPLAARCPWRWDTVAPLPDGALCHQLRPLPLRWFDTRAETDYVISDGTFATGDEGLRIGGYIDLAFAADLLNANYNDNCACAGLTDESPLLVVGDDGSRIVIGCSDDFDEASLEACEESQRQCSNIPTFCQQSALIGQFASTDADGDGIRESISFGLQIRAVGARVSAEAPFVDADEVCTDDIDNDGDGRTSCDDPECWDSNACDWTFRGEYCHNNWDDDGDGDVDCDDRQCEGNPACVAEGSGEGSGD